MTLGQGVIDWKADGFVLSAAQKKHYEEEGFIVIRNVIPQYELDRYKKRFQEICEKKNVPPTMTVMRDIQIAKSEYVSGEKAIMKLQDFGDDPILFDYCKHPAVISGIHNVPESSPVEFVGRLSVHSNHRLYSNRTLVEE